MDTIQGKAICKRILFEKNGFVIALFVPSDADSDLPNSFSIKGNFHAEQNKEYVVHGELDSKTKYDNSYDAIRVARDINLNKEDSKSVQTFLETVTSETRAKAIMETLDSPIDALESKDVAKLCTVKGIGVATAEKLIERYLSHKDYSSAYIELSKYGLTAKAIKKICDNYGDPDKAVAIIEENPYNLTEVDGYGFTRADSVFLSIPENKPTDHRRVRAYIEYMFEKEEEQGNSWMEPRTFVESIREFIPDADLKYAVEFIQSSEDYVYINNGDDKRISTREAYEIEKGIGEELTRLMTAKWSMELGGYEKQVEAIEKVNGWEYSEEQRSAIDDMVNNNVYMLQGYAGTGKTTTINAFLSAIESKGYSYSQTALSGKASDNLTQVTGKQGYTIHSLLGFNHETGGFIHHKNIPLPANVVVLDELSMVNNRIFLSLLRAIRTGSKLVMIGDYGQLEAIGVGVMGGMIRSKKIPYTLLQKIHRQAQDSAIITHSISVRKGIKPKGLELKPENSGVYGVNKDLEYLIVDNSEEDKILNLTIAKFKQALDKFDIDDIQIICSTKKSGKVSTYDLNKLAQMVYNKDADAPFVELGFKDSRYKIKEGDKVINMRNNKNTLSPDGVSRPIYNGNTGIAKEIWQDEDGDHILIDFNGIGEVVVDGESIKNIELGYAITVHKSQGSTIKCVIFALPFHYLLNTKELAYTGMTRASKYQVILTTPRSFNRAIKTTSVSKKKTHLENLFNQ